MAGMLEFWRSLLRQSNPSTLTAAGLSPKFILTQPPLRVEEDGEVKLDGGRNGNARKEATFSSLNRASWVNGLAALLGGDQQKNGGGEEANCVIDCSAPLYSCSKYHNSKSVKPRTKE